MALIGLPGAGKSVVAPRLAARLGWGWEDLDVVVERLAGRSVPELLRSERENRFREREAEALRTLFSPETKGLVLSCGGGVVVGADSRALLAANATVVWLRVEPEAARSRLNRDGVASRPLLGGPAAPDGTEAAADPDRAVLERLRALQAAREPLYEEIAALSVSTDGRSPAEVAIAVELALRARWAGSAS